MPGNKAKITQADIDRLQQRKIPVYVGVIGHRDVRMEQGNDVAIRTSVRRVLDHICKECSESPIILLTALAKGADQIVAEEFLAYAKRTGNANLRVRIVLPMPEDVYLNRTVDGIPDFSEADKARYREICKVCEPPYVIPYVSGNSEWDKVKDLLLDNAAGETETADRQFSEVERFISDHSMVYIALWNGELTQSAAGTATGIKDALHGKLSAAFVQQPLHIPENRPIYHIYTPKPGRETKPYDYHIRKIFPEPQLESGKSWYSMTPFEDLVSGEEALRDEVLSELFAADISGEKKPRGKKKADNEAAPLQRLIESEQTRTGGKKSEYLCRLQALSRRITEEKNKADDREKKLFSQINKIDEYNRKLIGLRKYVLGKRYGLGFAHSIKPSTAMVQDYFDDSDRLALWYRDRREKIGKRIIWLAGLAYIGLGVYSDMFNHPAIMFAYLAVMFFTYIIWRRNFRSRSMHNCYVDYRVLAEGLRVQGGWYEADVYDHVKYKNPAEYKAHVANVQDYYLRKQKNSITWVRFALRSINLEVMLNHPRTEAERIGYADDVDRVRNVCTYWLGLPDEKVTYPDGTEKWLPGITDPITGVAHMDAGKRTPPGQAAYLHKKIYGNLYSKKNKAEDLGVKKMAEKCDRLPNRLIIGAVIATILLAIYIALPLCGVNFAVRMPEFIPFSMESILLFLAGAFPVAAMMVNEHNRIMGYEEDLEHYMLTFITYKRAIEDVSDIFAEDGNMKNSQVAESKAVACQEILFEIGRESLQEHADWAALNIGRAPVVPN